MKRPCSLVDFLRVFLSSGIGTSAGLLSAIILVFFTRTSCRDTRRKCMKPQSWDGSLWLLQFFLSSFNIGASPNNQVWNETRSRVVLLLGIDLPNIMILLLKMCNLLQDLTFNVPYRTSGPCTSGRKSSLEKDWVGNDSFHPLPFCLTNIFLVVNLAG